MANKDKSTAITLTLLAGIIIQILFAFAESIETPGRVAVNFCKECLMLDKTMSNYLCEDLKSRDDRDMVEQYILSHKLEAKNMGFDRDYLRSSLYNIYTNVINLDKDSAKVRITGQVRKCINPIFTVIGKIFQIGETYTFDKVINLIKEDGQWKVCGKAIACR